MEKTYHNKEINELLRNVFWATPLTLKGKDALLRLKITMDEKSFLQKCYVEPFTDYTNAKRNEEVLDHDEDADTLNYREEKNHNILLADKAEFESSFLGILTTSGQRLNCLVDSIFLIKGSAGSGKTTYLHYLLSNHDEFISNICDLEKAEKSIFFLTGGFDFEEKYHSGMVWKFISIILPKISDLLVYTGDDISEHKKYLNDICNCYNKSFKQAYNVKNQSAPVVDDQTFYNFFSIIESYATSDKKYEDFDLQVRELFVSIFARGARPAVDFVMGVLVRLYYSLSKTAQNKGKKYICAIDNIERYIKETPIQDAELQIILSAIEGMVENFTAKLFKVIESSKEEYTASFGIVIAMRDTTANIGGVKHFQEGDHQIASVDITDWYDSLDIYKKKVEAFKDVCKCIECESVFIAFKNVIEDDSAYKWGLKNLSTQMYNHNHRRISTSIFSALNSTSPRIVEKFNDLWLKAMRLKSSCLKHLCRRLVLRILFDHIQEKKYLSNLTPFTKNSSDYNASNSFARRVTTYLSRISCNGNTNIYVSFPQLMKKVLCRPFFCDNTISTFQIRELSKILFLMDQAFIKENNWAPLIIIKFDDMSISYSKDTLFSKMQEEWEKYIKDKRMDDISQFAIKITDAGRFYAKTCPDFEHFSARYAPDYPPLVAVESYDQCKDLITEIRRKAFDCISEVIDTERSFFSSPGTMDSRNFNELYSDDGWLYKGNSSNRGTTHPLRIISNHMGYLHHFKEYLSVYAQDEDYKEQNDRRKMIAFVTETIRQYSSKQLEAIRNNPEYFRVD